MEYSPPPLFKQGPSAIARLIFFVTLAVALLVSDARFKTLEVLREAIGTGIYPAQRAALVPRDTIYAIVDFFTSSHQLRNENAELVARNLKLTLQQSQAVELEAENRHLRALLDLTQRPGIHSIPAEIQYDARDPFTQKVVIDRGSSAGIQLGAPVVDETGVMGQVTRVFPLQSEVTLISDKDEAIPVQLVRTGLRSVIYGTPRGEALDLRFVPTSADVKVGDELVTSGLDGVFPAGLPVARVAQVDRQADTAFAHVVCVSIAPVHGPRQLLVLQYQTPMPPPADLDTPPLSDKDANAAKNAAKKTLKAGTVADKTSDAGAKVAAIDARNADKKADRAANQAAKQADAASSAKAEKTTAPSAPRSGTAAVSGTSNAQPAARAASGARP